MSLVENLFGLDGKVFFGLAVKVCIRIKIRLKSNFAIVFGWKSWFGLVGKVGLVFL